MKQQATNHLLLKDDVGHSKPTTRDLPHNKFTYGKPEIRDPEDASAGTLYLNSNYEYSCNQLEVPLAIKEERNGQGLQTAK